MTDSSGYGPDRGRGNGGRRAPGRGTSEFQQAVDRLEKAVQDLVGSATSEFSERATSFLNETTTRLEREFRSARGDRGSGPSHAAYPPEYDLDEDDRPRSAAARMEARRRARQRAHRALERSPRLMRDPEHEKIAGVCAGIANYYGMEVWVVRCIAVTGLLFFPSIVFPAYWIMYFVMDSPKKERRRERRQKRSSGRSGGEAMPEPDLDVSPRRNLRNVQAELNEVELRLRRMESHVTSGQFELQRELNKIDVDPPGSAATNS